MAQLPVSCSTLGELDGGAAGAIIDAAIRDALADLDDRGFQDDKPRKVEITLTFGLLDNGQVGAHVEAIAKGPKRKTAGTIGQLRRDTKGMQLVFSQHSPDNPAQRTIEDVDEESRD